MPTVVDIPDVGVVEFPDGMSQEDVSRESESLYSRFARNQPPPKYEGMLAGPPGFEQPARSPEELAARNTRARQELGIPEGETPRTFGQIVTEPLVKLPRVTPQMAQDAWSFISAWGAAGEGWISPETAQEIAGAQSTKPGTAAKVTAGLVNAATSVPETFTSPLGMATLGAGTLGATGARLVSAGFAVDMLANTPHAVQAWRESLKTGDAALISEASAGLALHGLMTFAAGRHAVTSPKTIKAKQLADAIRVSEAEAGRLMETPEWKAAVDKAAAVGEKPVERFAPQTAEAMREMGPFKGEFVETGPRAPEAKVEPPVVPPARETVVPNVQTELETKPTELQPASPELKGAEDASRIPSDETKPAAAGVQPEAGEVVRSADVERASSEQPEPVVARGEEAERPAPEAPIAELTQPPSDLLPDVTKEIPQNSLEALKGRLRAITEEFNRPKTTKRQKKDLIEQSDAVRREIFRLGGTRKDIEEATYGGPLDEIVSTMVGKETPAPEIKAKAPEAPKPAIVGMGGAVPEELPPPTPQATISRLKAKEAARMEAKVKLPVEYDIERLSEQFDILTSEIGDALTTGGQFLAKQRRPLVAKGAPAESGTVTSKQVNQYFVNKLVTIINEIRRVKAALGQSATPEQLALLDLLYDRGRYTFHQVQELRRTSHEGLHFWKSVKGELIDMQQALGLVGDIQRRLPILDQLWKDTRERQFRRAGKDLLEFARVNLFTLGSWTLDFATNLAVAATKLPAFAMGDMVSLARGNSAHRMASALRAAWRSAHNLVPGERFRLAKEIESRLGTVAGAEFQGYGKEVMADFSEILKDKPAAAEQLKKLDIVLAAPVRMKRATDNFFGRLGASTELYHQAYEAGRKAGLKGDDLQTFVDNFFQTPPREAIDAAVKEGKEWKFNRDLTEWEEKFAANTITKLAIEAYPRWTLQFVRWAGEMLGLNPSLYLKIKQGRATQQEIIDGLVKAATGWGGIVAFNQLVYDNIDANTMEYVKEDGDRVRLSGRTPAPELFFITALLRGDLQKAKAALPQTSLPLAKLLGGEPGGIISPVVDTMRESVRGKYTAERTASELSKLLNNAIPGKSVLGFFRALYDPTIREGLGAPIPGVASLLPQKVEPTTGEPAAPMQRIPGTKFTFPTVGGTPFPGAVRDLNAIQAVLMNHGLAVTRPRRTSIIELPAEDVPKAQRREYEKIAGQNVKRIVGEAITNPDFWQSPPEIRRKLLQAWMNEARAQARNAMAAKYGTSNKPVKSEPIPVGLLPDRFKPAK